MPLDPLDLQALPLRYARIVFPPLWVVYMRPDDCPDGYVVRVWWGMTPEPDAVRFATLAQARAHIRDQGGCFCMHRLASDPEPVLESWL